MRISKIFFVTLDLKIWRLFRLVSTFWRTYHQRVMLTAVYIWKYLFSMNYYLVKAPQSKKKILWICLRGFVNSLRGYHHLLIHMLYRQKVSFAHQDRWETLHYNKNRLLCENDKVRNMVTLMIVWTSRTPHRSPWEPLWPFPDVLRGSFRCRCPRHRPLPRRTCSQPSRLKWCR